MEFLKDPFFQELGKALMERSKEGSQQTVAATILPAVEEIRQQRKEREGQANNWPRVEEAISSFHCCRMLPFNQGKLAVS